MHHLTSRLTVATLLLCVFAQSAAAQLFTLPKKPRLTGMYLQWGYNRGVYSRSDLHFANGNNYNFTLHQARAKDQPDYQAFFSHPLQITIPQNSYRIGFWMNPERTWAIEINYDHAKYVVPDNQNLRISGQIHGEPLDRDTIVRRNFVHMEHTDGANFYHINYVRQQPLWQGPRHIRTTLLTKVGAGLVVPRSYVILMGNKLDNKFHVAGYIVSAELGSRIYLGRSLHLEAAVKGGFANYLNALTVEGGRMHHHFWYGAAVGTLGYDIPFRKGAFH